MFSEKELSSLDQKIKSRLSHHRYIHTQGVKEAALKIAGYCYNGDQSEIAVAAMLHDISKEYSLAEQFEMIKSSNLEVTDTDLMSEPVFHSFTAPYVIKRDFPDFATEKVLSSTFNHTTGAPNMSLFDEIIFIADYIEGGRKYESCKTVRNYLYDAFEVSSDKEECVMHLHNATVMALENTIIEIVTNKKVLNERTVATRNAFLGRIPMPLAH